MLRSEAMTDSFMSKRCSLGRRGISGVSGATLLFSGDAAGDGVLPKLGAAPAEGVAAPVFVSFQSAMRRPPIKEVERSVERYSSPRPRASVSAYRQIRGQAHGVAVSGACGATNGTPGSGCLRAAPHCVEQHIEICAF